MKVCDDRIARKKKLATGYLTLKEKIDLKFEHSPNTFHTKKIDQGMVFYL